jgi:hypothetical protein
MTSQSAVDGRCADELRGLFDPSRFQNPAAVTLTMKKRVGGRNADSILASENFRQFMNRLNNKILGSAAKLHGRRLKTVAVIESNADGRLHYHAMIKRIIARSKHLRKPPPINGCERTLAIATSTFRMPPTLAGLITCSN